MQFVDLRPGSCLSNLTSQLSRLAADVALDLAESADAFDCFVGNRRVGGHMDIVERAPHVSPTCDIDDPAAFVDVMEASVAIFLQDAAKLTEM